MTEKNCIIVGAGEFDVNRICVGPEDLVIAADGGYTYCRRLGIRPGLILGDFDSLDEKGKAQMEEEGARILRLPVEKDDTDMLAAIRTGLDRGYRKFRLYGALGGRLDHTIANIQCLNFMKDQGAEGVILEENGSSLLARDETVTFDMTEGRMSLFALGERAEGVTIRNMKYTLQNAVLTNSFPIGVSNEFTGERGSVTVRKGTLLILLSREASTP